MCFPSKLPVLPLRHITIGAPSASVITQEVELRRARRKIPSLQEVFSDLSPLSKVYTVKSITSSWTTSELLFPPCHSPITSVGKGGEKWKNNHLVDDGYRHSLRHNWRFLATVLRTKPRGFSERVIGQVLCSNTGETLLTLSAREIEYRQ